MCAHYPPMMNNFPLKCAFSLFFRKFFHPLPLSLHFFTMACVCFIKWRHKSTAIAVIMAPTKKIQHRKKAKYLPTCVIACADKKEKFLKLPFFFLLAKNYWYGKWNFLILSKFLSLTLSLSRRTNIHFSFLLFLIVISWRLCCCC